LELLPRRLLKVLEGASEVSQTQQQKWLEQETMGQMGSVYSTDG